METPGYFTVYGKLDSVWYLFKDGDVSKVDRKHAIDANFEVNDSVISSMMEA